MAEIKDPRGKHLLGEAVRLLVQSGATGSSIVDFINEYSGVLEATLAPPSAAAQSDIKEQMKEALKEALLELAPPPRSRTESRKRVYVSIAGSKTSLSLRKDMYEHAVSAVGGPANAQRLVQEFANSKPDDHENRSAWVDEQLQHHLLLLKAESNLTGKTAH
jgi:RNA 3'-terminal phosphate cyclase